MAHSQPDYKDARNPEFTLRGLVISEGWQKCSHLCKGVITFSGYTSDFFEDYAPEITNDTVYLPSGEVKADNTFSWDKFEAAGRPIAQVGSWMRNHDSFKQLRVPGNMHKRVHLPLNNKSNWPYPDLLSHTVVFFDFQCFAPSNVLSDCIAHKTPVLIRNMAPAIEYLGWQYPLFFDDLDEATYKLSNPSKIYEAHQYLHNPAIQYNVKLENFPQQVADTLVYLELQ